MQFNLTEDQEKQKTAFGKDKKPKDRSNLPVTNPKDMESCSPPGKESRIATLKKLSELQENTERQFRETGKTIHKQNETFKSYEL